MELSVETLEQIDEMLRPRIGKLRRSFQSDLLNEVVAIEPPELAHLKDWIAIDGVKGYWAANIESASFWGLEIEHATKISLFFCGRLTLGMPQMAKFETIYSRNTGCFQAILSI